jgi:C-terminal processing protease CtpA/Prc
MEAFVGEIDRTYPFFDLKGIRGDWQRMRVQLLTRAQTCRSDQEFLGLVMEGVRCLRDSHMGFRKVNAKFPDQPRKYYASVSFWPATSDRVIVMFAKDGIDLALKSGTIVTKIDGKDARQYLEQRAAAAWNEGGHNSSPQRTRMYEYRIPLRGAQGEKHTITILAGGRQKQIALTNDTEARGWPHTYNMPKNMKRVGRSTWHTRLPSGVGYVYLRRVDQSTVPGLKEAVATHAGAAGWILDLRGNGGGGYGRDMFEQLKAMPRPVAGLIDAGCMSAGETLARDIVGNCGARLFGTKTAGASSAKRTWTFPSGIGTMSFPTRSRYGIGGKLIEFNGVEPHEIVEPVPEEVQRGQNSAILRAEEYILKTARKAVR